MDKVKSTQARMIQNKIFKQGIEITEKDEKQEEIAGVVNFKLFTWLHLPG